MADRTLSFHRFEDDPRRSDFAWPVTVHSMGYEIRDEASYRWDNQRHGTNGHVFQYTLSGSGSFVHTIDGKNVIEPILPGKIFIASHDCPYLYYARHRQPWEFVWIMLTGEFADRACAELRNPSPVFPLDPDATPVQFLKTLLDRLAGPFVLDHYSLSAAAYDFLGQLLKLKRELSGQSEDRFLRSVRDFTVRNLKTVHLGALAEHFGYSPRYFITYFQQRMNTTPHHYILLQKIRYASLLLINTKKSIHQVAVEVGFAEDSYFSKIFRRHQGMAPTEFRQRNRDVFSVDDIVVL